MRACRCPSGFTLPAHFGEERDADFEALWWKFVLAMGIRVAGNTDADYADDAGDIKDSQDDGGEDIMGNDSEDDAFEHSASEDLIGADPLDGQGGRDRGEGARGRRRSRGPRLAAC